MGGGDGAAQLPSLPLHVHWLPSIDALVAAEEPAAAGDDEEERPVARRTLNGRKPMAVWRGGRGASCAIDIGDSAAATAKTLRERLVEYCAARPTLFDVGFHETAPPLSRKQLVEGYRVRLAVDAEDGSSSWDVGGWKSALLHGGCVLVAVGNWRPPMPQIVPWEHFAPVGGDLAELEAVVEWAATSVEAAEMAKRLDELGRALRAPGHALRSLAAVLAEEDCVRG